MKFASLFKIRNLKKNYTYIRGFAHRACRAVALTLFILSPVLFSSCEFWNVPVRDYLERYTQEIAIEKYEIEGVESYYDADGNLCIPSGQDGGVQVTLFMRNPYHYKLGSTDPSNPDLTSLGYQWPGPYILNDNFVASSDVVIAQDENDTTLLRFTYPPAYLTGKDKNSDRNIGGTIGIKHPYNGQSQNFTFKLQCNSKPPKISDGAVMNKGNIYYLGFNIPMSDIHRDLKKIIINDGRGNQTVEINVNSSIIQLPNPCILSTTKPEGLVPIGENGTLFNPSNNTNNFYYNSGIQVIEDAVQSFTITLVDEAGLSTSTVISTASKKVETPTVRDAVANVEISSSNTATLQLNDDFNAQIKIIKPTRATNGDPISGAEIHYTLQKSDDNETPAEEGNENKTIENTGTYTLKVWAKATGYLQSDTKTCTIEVPPLKVRFNPNGGTLKNSTPQSISKNVPTQLNPASSVVEKTGYTFTGWTDEDGSTYTDRQNITISKDIYLTASWQPTTYKVTLNTNGGSCNTQFINVTYDSTYGSDLPTSDDTSLTKYGYNFTGWYTEQSGGSKVEASTPYRIADNSTLWARWGAKSFLINYNLNGGSGTTPNQRIVTFGQTYNSASALVQPNASKTGYSFKCWCLDAAGTQEIGSSTTVQNDDTHTLYAKWSPRKYTVNFDANGGTCSTASTEVTYDDTYGNGTATWPDGSGKPERTGYTFAGWYTQPTVGNEITSTTTVKIEATTTLYAHWTPRQCTVNFDLNGASGSASSITVTYDQPYGTLPTPTSATGYYFDGWYTSRSGGTKVTEDTIVDFTTTKTLFAHNYYDYLTNFSYCRIGTINASNNDFRDSKIGKGATVKVKLEGTNSSKYPNGIKVIRDDDSTELPITITEIKEDGEITNKVYVSFTMPNSTVTIQASFWNAYLVNISPLSCTYDDSNEFVKRQTWNEYVRIWIASNEGSFDSNYKQVKLDDNAKYSGYIILPTSYTSLTNAKVCAMTIENVGINNTVGGSEEYGLGFASVSSNQANITMNILNISTASGSGSYGFKAKSKTGASYPYNTIDPFSENLGLKYYWIITHNNGGTHTFVYEGNSGTTNNYNVPTQYLQNGSNGIRVKIKVADLEVGGGRTIFSYPSL